MTTIEFTTNPNGKLFNDYFGDVRLKDLTLSEGLECEILLNHQSLGIARIEVIRTLPYDNGISDALSYLNCGKPAYKQSALLARYYNGGKPLPPETIIVHIIFGYTERNIVNQTNLFEKWWKTKTESLCSNGF